MLLVLQYLGSRDWSSCPLWKDKIKHGRVITVLGGFMQISLEPFLPCLPGGNSRMLRHFQYYCRRNENFGQPVSRSNCNKRRISLMKIKITNSQLVSLQTSWTYFCRYHASYINPLLPSCKVVFRCKEQWYSNMSHS